MLEGVWANKPLIHVEIGIGEKVIAANASRFFADPGRANEGFNSRAGRAPNRFGFGVIFSTRLLDGAQAQ